MAFDAASQGDILSSTTLTVSHTCTGADRVLLVSLITYTDGGSAEPTSVTYNSVAMTKLATLVYGLSAHQRISLYGLKAPATTANDIVATFASAEDELTITAVSYTGIDQTTPWGTASTFLNDDTTDTSIDIASAIGDLVTDAVGWYNGTITTHVSQDQRVHNDNTTTLDSGVQSDEAGAGTVTMSHSWSATEYSGHIAVNLNAAAAGSPATIPKSVRNRRLTTVRM